GCLLEAEDARKTSGSGQLCRTTLGPDRGRRRHYRRRYPAGSRAPWTQGTVAGATGFCLGHVESFFKNGTRRSALSRNGRYSPDASFVAGARATTQGTAGHGG